MRHSNSHTQDRALYGNHTGSSAPGKQDNLLDPSTAFHRTRSQLSTPHMAPTPTLKTPTQTVFYTNKTKKYILGTPSFAIRTAASCRANPPRPNLTGTHGQDTTDQKNHKHAYRHNHATKELTKCICFSFPGHSCMLFLPSE